MSSKPNEYYVSIGNHSELKASYFENVQGTINWNVNIGMRSHGKGYVNFSTGNSAWYQLSIIKIDKGHS